MEPSAAVLKRELRTRVRRALRALPPAALASQSASAVAQLLASPVYASATTLALYSSLPGELDTATLVAAAFRDGKRVFLPRVASKRTGTMLMLEASCAAEIASYPRSDWGIAEPPVGGGRAEAPADTGLDLVVVPGVAFDVRGGRCGQGMGFYDTFFARYLRERGAVPRLVALALRPQVVDEVPMTETDWRVDGLLVAEEFDIGV
jgi:5-formyltetrahydrofolate cyclo-ligase